MANTTKKNSVKTTSTNKVNNTNNSTKKYDDEIAELKKMIQMLSEQNKMLMEQNNSKEEKIVIREEKSELNNTRLIKVISLCSNELNLSQLPRGEGKIYKFNKLGVSKTIPAYILEDIVSTHPTLAEKGYFFICDETFVREHGLESDYENLINIEVIENIFKEDKNTLKEVLSTCKVSQLDTIIDIIAQKVVEGSITLDELEDTGKISIINKICKERKENELYNFKEMVENLKEVSNSRK